MHIAHYISDDRKKTGYGIIEDDYIYPLKNCEAPGDVFGMLQKGKVKTRGKIHAGEIQYLPPTEKGRPLYCAGLNYRDHAEEVKMPVPANPVFFTKSSGSLCSGYDGVIYPEQVQLLDYEIELAVVIGKEIESSTELTGENLHEYILGIAIMNDVSARDIQLGRGQWFLGKSFRTFAPLGPVLQVYDRDVAERLYDLTLSLSVSDSRGRPYDNKKQSGTTGNMIFPIHRLLRELAACFDLLPGDVVATGTPAGVAMSSPGRLETRIADLIGMSQGQRTARFLEREKKKNDRYLVPGDVIQSRIYSSDRVVDLGMQCNEIIRDLQREYPGRCSRRNGMNIIDFHTHVFPEDVVGNREKYFDDGGFRSLYDNEKSRMISHAALLEEMGNNGIARSLCMGFPWEREGQCRYQNEYLGEAVADNAGVLYAFGSIPFRGSSVYNAVKEISALGLQGIGEIAFYGWDDPLARERYLRGIFGCAGDFSLPVCIHVNEPVGHKYPGKYDTDMAMLYDVIAEHPGVTVILAHWGGGILFYELMPEVKKAFGNVFYDTAATPYLYDPAVYSAACAIISSRKILFGSDYPLLAPGRYFREMEEQIPENGDRENILFRNALRILEE